MFFLIGGICFLYFTENRIYGFVVVSYLEIVMISISVLYTQKHTNY